ncbi:MAG: TonB-dependent receptor, partial [Candidatus Eremiobacteraeota bacterium]|nr:TonB-dependent receptor [Candidatus Eremiobacteraeota bacterium]
MMCTVLPASAQSGAPTPAALRATGTVTDANGGPLSGASVSFTGPSAATTTSGPDGRFVVDLQPGVYAITVTRSGYLTSTLTDFAVVAGQPATVNVSLVQPTLNSLQVIGRVRTSSLTRGVFNTTTAAQTVVNAQDFRDQGQSLQIDKLLDETPGIVVGRDENAANGAAPGAIQYALIRGALKNETSTLIDGHQLGTINGGFGLQDISPAVLGGAELIKGPGGAPPQISNSIGGTLNLRTLDPSAKPTGAIVYGFDSYGGSNSSITWRGTSPNGRLGYVIVYAVTGTPGPLNGHQYYTSITGNCTYVNATPAYNATTGACTGGVGNTYVTTGTAPPGVGTAPQYNNAKLIGCCLPVDSAFENRSTLLKLRYNLTNTTQLTASYVGFNSKQFFDGAHVQIGNTTFAPTNATANYGLFAPGDLVGIANNVGAVSQYSATNLPVFQEELRQQVGHDTLLARAYQAVFDRPAEDTLPDPNGSQTNYYQLYGTVGSTVYNGQAVPVTFAPQGCSGTSHTPDPNSPYCATPTHFAQVEIDRLHGGSFEYDHFAGPNVYTLSYDSVHVDSFTSRLFRDILAGTPPGSRQSINSLMLRGQLNPSDKLALMVAGYVNTFGSKYSIDGGQTFTSRTIAHDDVRVGLSYRATRDVSYRFAAGSSISPPTLGEIGTTTGQQLKDSSGLFYTQQVNNPDLRAETSFGYDLGASYRFPDGATVLSWDGYLTNVYGQLVTSYVPNGTATADPTKPLFLKEFLNLSNSRYEGLELQLKRAPVTGFGYTAQGALIRAYTYNLPSSLYGPEGTFVANLAIIPNGNFYANSGFAGSGSTTSVGGARVPYAQGYGELNYRGSKNVFTFF